MTATTVVASTSRGRPRKASRAGGMSRLREEMVETARRIEVDELTLRGWYELQLASVRAQVDELAGKLDRNLKAISESPKGDRDERWPMYWRQTAKYDYLARLASDHKPFRGTLPRLEEVTHPLVCPQHGIDGVSPDMWRSVTTNGAEELSEQEMYEALSLRGVLEGGLGTHLAWHRPCLDCAAPLVAAYAEQLQRSWLAPTPPGPSLIGYVSPRTAQK